MSNEDLRFETEQTWRRQMAEMRARAEREALALGGGEGSIAAMALLLECGDPEIGDLLAEAVPSFPEPLRLDGLRFLAHDVDLRPASWWTIAKALARCAGGEPSAISVFKTAERLGRTPNWVHDLFEDACVAHILARPDKRERWLAELGRAPKLVTPPDRAYGPVTLRPAEPEWKLEDVFELWSYEGLAMAWMDAHAPSSLLLRLDPARWLQAIDAWDEERLVAGALSGVHVFHDREALLTWLAAAQPCFDSIGAWTGRCVAVLLTDDILQYAEQLSVAVATTTHCLSASTPDELSAESRELRDVELPAFFKLAWSVLLDRPDGVMIASAFHARLCDAQRPGLRRSARDVLPVARDTLAAALAARRVSTPELMRLALSRREVRSRHGARAGYASGVCALVSALDVSDREETCAEGLLEATLQRLEQPDPDWEVFAHAGALETTLRRIAARLASRADALAKCEELYERLEPMRRRGELGFTYATNNADASSILTLFLTLTLALDSATERESAKRASANAVRAATRLELTSSPGFRPPLSARHTLAFALAVLAATDRERLPAALTIVLTDPPLAAIALATILQVLSAAELDEILRTQESSIETVTARSRAWAEATGRPDDEAAAASFVDAVAKSSAG